MLLKRLVEYADRIVLPPPLYSEVPVRYIIELDAEGRPLGRPVDTSDPASPRTKRGQPMTVPNVQRSSGIKPLLFADNGEYTLGIPRPASKADRVQACHDAYVELVGRCAEATKKPAVLAVRSFLHAHLGDLELPPDFDPSATMSFRTGGIHVTDLESVQQFWANEHSPSSSNASVMQCVVCRQELAVLDRLQAKIKRIPGGQSSGTALVSANEDAFESYGLKASLVSPICARCAERLTKSLNDLLAGEASRVVIGPTVFVSWTREDIGFSFRDFLSGPKAAQVKALIESTRTGGRVSELDSVAFYTVALSASGGRAVVRDWIDTTVGAVQERLARWFELQAIVGADGSQGDPLGIWALAAATVRDVAKDLAPPVPRSLIRTALTGTPLPAGLLFQAVRRNKADAARKGGPVTRPRAALIKAVLLSGRRDVKRGEMVMLDSNNNDPAYLCGRLMAVLEGVQRAALPGVKAGIVDRFFGSASTAPASVFGRLLKGAQPHLARLERDKPGAYVALQHRLGEVLDGIEGAFPTTLTLQDQGLFALGYYHQRAHDWAQARSRKELRDLASDVTSEETTGTNREES